MALARAASPDAARFQVWAAAIEIPAFAEWRDFPDWLCGRSLAMRVFDHPERIYFFIDGIVPGGGCPPDRPPNQE